MLGLRKEEPFILSHAGASPATVGDTHCHNSGFSGKYYGMRMFSDGALIGRWSRTKGYFARCPWKLGD